MKLFISIVAVAFISNLAAAWNVDDRCTRRRLEEFRFNLNEAEQRQSTKISGKNLRAPGGGPLPTDLHHVSDVVEAVGEAVDTRRELQLSTVFQLKMYHEDGYCWQEEWDERRWCLQCAGGSCGENDNLVIEECSSSDDQRFVYQGEKLKPYTRQDLCWNAHQLKPCGDDDTQLIKGLQYDGNFEMHPNGNSDDCLVNQDHHPKSGETVRPSSCASARNDKTSLWVMINKGGGGDGGGDDGGGSGGGGGGGTRADFKGSEYCDSTECGLCQGDCDDDNQCAGDLVCCQRNIGDRLPTGCDGRRHLDSNSDFCGYEC